MFESKLTVPGHLSAVSGAHGGRNHVSFITEKLKPVVVSLLRVTAVFIVVTRVFT